MEKIKYKNDRFRHKCNLLQKTRQYDDATQNDIDVYTPLAVLAVNIIYDGITDNPDVEGLHTRKVVARHSRVQITNDMVLEFHNDRSRYEIVDTGTDNDSRFIYLTLRRR